MNKSVIIIGAGLTGLATAYYLKKAGIGVTVIEKSSHIGGVIQTHAEEGFVYESGPNTGTLSHPEVAELFEELAPACQIITANPKAKRRLIWKGQKWHELPSGPISAITTPLYTFRDKLRVLYEPWRRPGTNPLENLAGFVKRRLGKSFLDYAVDPFVSGVYAGNADYLIPKYALPKLYNLEQQYGSLVKGMIAKAKERKHNPRLKKATREVFSVKGGLQRLIETLSSYIGYENIELNCTDTTIHPFEGGFKVVTNINGVQKTNETPYVITTVGAYAIQHIIPFLSEDEVKPFNELRYAKVVQAILGYKKWEGININAFGGLVPSVENKKILGVLFTSSFFEARSPAEGALLSVFMGGTRRPEQVELNDNGLFKLLQTELPTMMGLQNFSPDVVKFFRYPFAIPQYGANTKERLAMIERIQDKYPGLVLAGNMRDGIGMADRIKQARTIAEEVIGS
jgi:protoporphyrinogen/coproporphyrinogen III oxidase